MQQLDLNSINSARTAMLYDNQIKRNIEENYRNVANIVANNPMVGQLKTLVEQTHEQNRILEKQIELLTEENERQRKQVEEAQKAEEQAKKEARNSKVFAWITFAIATVISLAALVVSIIAIL